MLLHELVEELDNLSRGQADTTSTGKKSSGKFMVGRISKDVGPFNVAFRNGYPGPKLVPDSPGMYWFFVKHHATMPNGRILTPDTVVYVGVAASLERRVFMEHMGTSKFTGTEGTNPEGSVGAGYEFPNGHFYAQHSQFHGEKSLEFVRKGEIHVGWAFLTEADTSNASNDTIRCDVESHLIDVALKRDGHWPLLNLQG